MNTFQTAGLLESSRRCLGGVALSILFLTPLFALKGSSPLITCTLDADEQVIEGCSINSVPAPFQEISQVFADLPIAEGSWIMLVTENYFGEPCLEGITFDRIYTLLDDLNGNHHADANEFSFSCEEHFIVADHLPPVFLEVPTGIIAECTPHLPAPTVDNPCGDIELFSTELGFISPCNPDAPEYPVLWTAIDGCGNITEVNQMLYVRDTKGPVFMGVPADTCALPGLVANVTAFDSCSNTFVPVIFNEQTEVNTCGLRVKRTWSATDQCGNLSTAVQIISAPDSEPPVIFFNHPDLSGLSNGATISRECINGQAPDFDESAVFTSDNCSEVIVTMNRSLLASGNCAVDGFVRKYRYRWTASDFCGNQSQIYVDLELTDHTPPVLLNVPDNIHLYCDADLPPVANVTPMDNCGIEVFSFKELQFILSPAYTTVLRQWRAIDSCGNKTVDVQAILVEHSQLSVAFQVNGSQLCGSSGNTISATASGGNAPYGFEWHTVSGDGAITSNPFMPQVTFSLGQEPLTLAVEVFDVNSCIQTFTRTITCVPPPFYASPPAVASLSASTGQWQVFPNPATTMFWLNLEGDLAENVPTQYELTDELGRIVAQGTIDSAGESLPSISVEHLAQGLYQLKLYSVGTAPQIKRVLVQR